MSLFSGSDRGSEKFMFLLFKSKSEPECEALKSTLDNILQVSLCHLLIHYIMVTLGFMGYSGVAGS